MINDDIAAVMHTAKRYVARLRGEETIKGGINQYGYWVPSDDEVRECCRNVTASWAHAMSLRHSCSLDELPIRLDHLVEHAASLLRVAFPESIVIATLHAAIAAERLTGQKMSGLDVDRLADRLLEEQDGSRQDCEVGA